MSQNNTTPGQITLEIVEPKGVLADPKREGLSNPRLDTLNGKTIALMSIQVSTISSFGSDLFFDILEEMLKHNYSNIRVVRVRSFGDPKAKINSDEIAASCDAWIDGVKDAITLGRHDVGVYMERSGKPGVSICSEVLLPLKRAQADFNGMPTTRLVTVPATEFCTAKRDLKLMKAVVEKAFADIVNALTNPLQDEEQFVSDIQYDYSPKTFSDTDYAQVYEDFLQYCNDNVLTDGLPVVPPTKKAVEWMLSGTSYPRDKEIGLMFPKRGIATVEKIAISAVMAGAKPEYLPVIITIIETITAKDFNQYHIVNEILPVIFISGPIISELGINNKVGYLAPGHRINSTIGRAVLMCMINIGWRDMSIYSSPGGPGRPAAYANYFIVENQEENPWESWAEQNGFSPEDSIITVCEATSESRGPAEVFSNVGFQERLDQVSDMFSRKGDLFKSFGMPENGQNVRHMIVLHPSLAWQMANAGFTKQSLVRYLYEKNAIDWDAMSEAERRRLKDELSNEKTAARSKMFMLTPEDVKQGLHREPFSVPEHVLVIVAGSGAGNSIVFQTVFGSTANVEDVAETRPYMSKLIRGATLTKYGR